VRVAVVSRGYGAGAGKHNDEALELAQSLRGVPHVQNPDRAAAARKAIHEHGAQLILLDDGFQHRRLARDLDLVLLDALEPFGFDHVFPRGTLREPETGLARAQVVCLSRADVIPPVDRDAIRQRVSQLAPTAVWCELLHSATGLMNTNGETKPLDSLAGQRAAAFCGIGNPAGFEHTLKTAGCEVVAWRSFPDHHHYTEADIASLSAWVRSSNATIALCTQKDLVKVPQNELGGIPLQAITIDMQFQAGQQEFEQALDRIQPR
jgi:tetraacyldisaccharide 4'-kinase